MINWKLFPVEIQDRILTFYKWENAYIKHCYSDHKEAWEQLNDDLMATEESTEGDWAGDPSYEKFKVMRPNMTTMVFSEFWPTPDDIE